MTENNQVKDLKLNWKKEHDDCLISIVKVYGDTDWLAIAEQINNKYPSYKKTGKECRNRWRYIVNMGIGKQLWGDRERFYIIAAHQKHKNKWAEIAKEIHLQGRNVIKNRFYTLFRKICNKIKNMELEITSELDLLEVHYVILLIDEFYSEKDQEKNYIHKLVDRMDKTKIMSYKEKFFELYANKGTIDDLFKKCEEMYGKLDHKNPKLNIEANEIAIDCNKIPLECNEIPMDILEDKKSAIEPMECNEVDLRKCEEKFKIKITLPPPKEFNNSDWMTTEEKDEFWKSAFVDKSNGSKSALDLYKSPYSMSSESPDFNQAHSAGMIEACDDANLGFSQVSSRFEIGMNNGINNGMNNDLLVPPKPEFQTRKYSLTHSNYGYTSGTLLQKPTPMHFGLSQNNSPKSLQSSCINFGQVDYNFFNQFGNN